jgi:hypothetical protein
MSDQDWADVKTKQQKRETKTKPKEEDKKKQKEGKAKNKDEKQKQKLKQSQEKNQPKKQKNEDSDEEEDNTNYLASTIYSQAEKILEEKQKVKNSISRCSGKKSRTKISKKMEFSRFNYPDQCCNNKIYRDVRRHQELHPSKRKNQADLVPEVKPLLKFCQLSPKCVKIPLN